MAKPPVSQVAMVGIAYNMRATPKNKTESNKFETGPASEIKISSRCLFFKLFRIEHHRFSPTKSGNYNEKKS